MCLIRRWWYFHSGMKSEDKISWRCPLSVGQKHFRSILLLHIRFDYMNRLRRYWLSSLWDTCLCTLSLVHRAVTVRIERYAAFICSVILHTVLQLWLHISCMSVNIHAHCSANVNRSGRVSTCGIQTNTTSFT
jgi:hypothetical protein